MQMSVKISQSSSANVLPAAQKAPLTEHFAELQGSRAEPAPGEAVIVLAQLRQEDFQLARFAIKGVERYQDYGDWLDARLGFIFGLQISGLTVETVDVEVLVFLTWCRTRRIAPNERLLDLYAKRLFSSGKTRLPKACS